ncbi:MAG: hypothetical protein K5869_07670 [Saccharofermentans sp.]|nr:hypothetical protein [Saccharofermentans sp.]
MFLSGTFTKAVMYIMLLCDSIIAGYFIGESGVAAINAFLTILIFYLEQMVYSDGDELCNNICYVFQIGGNILFSIILTKYMGMMGIILGSVIGNGLGILTCCWHYFRKCNTLHFEWHFSFKDFLLTSRYSIVDSSVYLCWALMDYVMIGFVSKNYGDTGLITLAVVVSLIEFGVVLDGVGMAMQPLSGTYYGEKNHKLIKRVMKAAIKAALIEGVIATVLICIFARQFCGLFGITEGAALAPSMSAIRTVSLGFMFVSVVSLTTSYYMLIDRIGMSVMLKARGQGNTDGLEYVYAKDDEVVRTDELLIKNVKMNKVSMLSRELGKAPVLCFGNSSGDESMAAYTTQNEKYKAKAFMLVADDDVRDYGNVEKGNEKAENGDPRDMKSFP